MIWFGPAGTSESFGKMGYKATHQTPEYLAKLGLNAYEYQCGRGVRVNAESAAKLKAGSEAHGIRMSLHSPYYISLSSVDEEKRKTSIVYILQSAAAARLIGADRIVVHSGSATKITREEALELSKDTLKKALEAMDAEGYGDIHLCPETMGKIGQLGTLEEVMALCSIDERLIPCIDFGHIYARTLGGLKTLADFEKIFETMDNTIGRDRLRQFHAHFSKIAFTEKGGEKEHVTYASTEWGPEFDPLAELIVRYDCSPVIICESAGTQAEDAATMKGIYEKLIR